MAAPEGRSDARTQASTTALLYLDAIVGDLLAAPDVTTARQTLIDRLQAATGARAVALVSVDHARLRCRLDALQPATLRMSGPAELPLATAPLPRLLDQPGPVRLHDGTRVPWLPASDDPVLCAPLRRRQSVTGLLIVQLGATADVAVCERLLAITASAAALGLDAVRREDREEFLAMVRHDIYNPMTVAMFHAEMLAETLGERGDRPGADLALSVLSCLNAVCDLVSNFFYLEAIDEGAPAIHPQAVDAYEVAEEIADAHRPLAQARRIDLTLTGGALPLHADRRQLGRVVANLVGNALKYTDGPGRVSIEVSRTADEGHIAVRDTGAGMRAQDVARLFEKHARFHQHLGIPGTGLGLYLSKAIVEAHGGVIDVASVPGEGSVFTVRLPLG